MASTGFKNISQVAEIFNRQEIDEKDRHLILELLTKTLGENIHLKSSLDTKNQEINELNSKILEHDDILQSALLKNKEVIEQLDMEIKCHKETWQRQFQQLKENRELLENHQASIEYLQEQVKEKDEEIKRLKEKNVGNIESKKYVECEHDDGTLYYYPITEDEDN
jgi:chromosome segregation ATPase